MFHYTMRHIESSFDDMFFESELKKENRERERYKKVFYTSPEKNPFFAININSQTSFLYGRAQQ